MRIALVHPFPWPQVRRGAERYLDDLSRYLAGHGHDVTVVTGSTGPARVERNDDGVTYVYRPLRHGPALHRAGMTPVETFGLSALGALRHTPCDVVHALTPSGAVAGRLAGRPTLYTILGHPDPDQLPSALIPRHLFLGALRMASATAVLSRASASALRRLAGRAAVVLPPGVALERFVPSPSPRPDPPRVLFSASLADPRKRPDLAVEALAGVLDRHPGARLALSGSGDATDLLALAGRIGNNVASAIDVLGPGRPEDVPARYRQATVTVLPAEHEAFGLALVESLASGTPVVCTPSGGMAEIVTPEVGAVAGAATPEALADALEAAITLAADPATSQRCVTRAQRWDWDSAVGPAHVEMYERLAAGSNDASPLGPW